MAKPRATIADRTRRALAKINKFTEDGVEGYAKDSAELSRRLLQDNISSYPAKNAAERTGMLARSLEARKGAPMAWAIATDAQNEKGMGYGAAQEYGWTTKDGKKMKGRFFIIRGTMGMLARWRKGGRWNPEG